MSLRQFLAGAKFSRALKPKKILDFFHIFAYNSKTMPPIENCTLTKMKKHRFSRKIMCLKVEIGSAV